MGLCDERVAKLRQRMQERQQAKAAFVAEAKRAQRAQRFISRMALRPAIVAFAK